MLFTDLTQMNGKLGTEEVLRSICEKLADILEIPKEQKGWIFTRKDTDKYEFEISINISEQELTYWFLCDKHTKLWNLYKEDGVEDIPDTGLIPLPVEAKKLLIAAF